MTDLRDYLLDEQQYRKVREQARRALEDAGVIGVFPTPIETVMEASRIEEATDEILDEGYLKRFWRGAKKAGKTLKKALGKVIGLFDAVDRFIVVDKAIHYFRRKFVRLHEVGHSVMPWQRDLYHVVGTTDQSLDPETADLFDREADLFAKECIFQNDAFIEQARDYPLGLNAPCELREKFDASIHSAVWEYVARHPRPCAVIITSIPQIVRPVGLRARRKQVICSPAFERQFGNLKWPWRFTPDDSIGALLSPIPTTGSDKTMIQLVDNNGDPFDCIAEAMTNTFCYFVLIYPVRALSVSVPGAAISTVGVSTPTTKTP